MRTIFAEYNPQCNSIDGLASLTFSKLEVVVFSSNAAGLLSMSLYATGSKGSACQSRGDHI